MGNYYVSLAELLTAAGVLGAANVAVFSWLFGRVKEVDDRVTSSFEAMDKKQDKDICLPSHVQFNEAQRRLEQLAQVNGERLATIETCLKFLVEALKEHKKEHERYSGGL